MREMKEGGEADKQGTEQIKTYSKLSFSSSVSRVVM